jgi:hypothetical protein
LSGPESWTAPRLIGSTDPGAQVAQLFAGATQDFVDRTMQNRIAQDLKDAFFAFHGFNPSPREQKSWSNSLKALSNAIVLGGFTEHGILLEYQLPLSPSQNAAENSTPTGRTSWRG